MSGSGDRGQAFTLEGVVAAMMVLIALLFALEAVLVTPITTGAVDEGTQSRLGAEASDVLRITARVSVTSRATSSNTASSSLLFSAW